MQGPHGLKRHDSRASGRLEDLADLAFVGAEGLLDQDMLAARDAGECLVVVQRVGAANVDRIDLVACGQLIE